MVVPEQPAQAAPCDDRGKTVELRSLGGAAAGPSAGDDAQLADLRMRIQVLVATDRPTLHYVLIALAGAGVGVVMVAVRQVIPGMPNWLFAAVIGIGIAVLVGWMGYGRRTRRHASAVIDAFLREGRCPGCAYVLDGTVSAPDGCVVCPECGAAWKRDRVGSSNAAAPALREYRRRVYQPTMRERWLPGSRGLLMARDARGRPVHVTNPRLRGLDGATRRRIGAERAAAIRARIGWRQRGKGLAVSLVMLPAFFAFGAMIVRMRAGATPLAMLMSITTFAFVAFILVVLLGLVYTMLLGDSGLLGNRVAREFVARGVCPQCLEPLDGLGSDPDGLVTCARCAAAWRARAAGPSTAPEPPAAT